MTPELLTSCRLVILPDGPSAFVVMRDGAALAWIERHPRNRLLWRALMVTGTLLESPTISGVLDALAGHLGPV